MSVRNDLPLETDIDKLTDYAKVKLLAECVRLNESHKTEDMKQENENPNLLQLADDFYNHKNISFDQYDKARIQAQKYLTGSSPIDCLSDALYRVTQAPKCPSDASMIKTKQHALNLAIYNGIHNSVNQDIPKFSETTWEIYNDLRDEQVKCANKGD